MDPSTARAPRRRSVWVTGSEAALNPLCAPTHSPMSRLHFRPRTMRCSRVNSSPLRGGAAESVTTPPSSTPQLEKMRIVSNCTAEAPCESRRRVACERDAGMRPSCRARHRRRPHSTSCAPTTGRGALPRLPYSPACGGKRSGRRSAPRHTGGGSTSRGRCRAGGGQRKQRRFLHSRHGLRWERHLRAHWRRAAPPAPGCWRGTSTLGPSQHRRRACRAPRRQWECEDARRPPLLARSPKMMLGHHPAGGQPFGRAGGRRSAARPRRPRGPRLQALPPAGHRPLSLPPSALVQGRPRPQQR